MENYENYSSYTTPARRYYPEYATTQKAPKITRIYEAFKNLNGSLDVSYSLYTDDQLYEFVMAWLESMTQSDNSFHFRSPSTSPNFQLRESQFNANFAKFQKEKENFLTQLKSFDCERLQFEKQQKLLQQDQKTINTQLKLIDDKLSKLANIKSKFKQYCANYQTELQKRENVIKLKESNLIQLDKDLRKEKDQLIESVRLFELQQKFQQQALDLQRKDTYRQDSSNPMIIEDILSNALRLEIKKQELAELEQTLAYEKVQIENTTDLFENIQNDLEDAKLSLVTERQDLDSQRGQLQEDKRALMEVMNEVERQKSTLRENQQSHRKPGSSTQRSDRYSMFEIEENSIKPQHRRHTSETTNPLEDTCTRKGKKHLNMPLQMK